METTGSQPSRLRALVTGASAGIGEAFAERLAKDGYDVIVVARNQDRLATLAAKLAKKYQARVEPLSADLTDPTQLRVVESTIEGEEVDLLVNNAGFGTVGPFAEADADAEEMEIRLNVIAVSRLTQAALPGMIERRRGAIINVSSIAGFQPSPFSATYAATKAFITSFSESLAEELRGSGVYIQALCPGFTRTEFQDRAGIDVSSLPSFVWMSPEDVVDAALAARESGEVICVPGMVNKLASTVSGMLPRSLLRQISGAGMRRFRG